MHYCDSTTVQVVGLNQHFRLLRFLDKDAAAKGIRKLLLPNESAQRRRKNTLLQNLVPNCARTLMPIAPACSLQQMSVLMLCRIHLYLFFQALYGGSL